MTLLSIIIVIQLITTIKTIIFISSLNLYFLLRTCYLLLFNLLLLLLLSNTILLSRPILIWNYRYILLIQVNYLLLYFRVIFYCIAYHLSQRSCLSLWTIISFINISILLQRPSLLWDNKFSLILWKLLLFLLLLLHLLLLLFSILPLTTTIP